jgi:hypothetical protein
MILTNVTISPRDLLDAAQSIPLGHISRSNWLVDWISAETFLEWAQRGLRDGDVHGLSNAITYAKRSVACRIDVLVQYNHLVPLVRANYPTKIKALTQVGFSIPDVVQELVIDPRNELEHAYQRPNCDVARHAVGICELFLNATKVAFDQASIVAVGRNILGSHGFGPGGPFVKFRQFGERPMLFIDVFGSKATAKIVDGKNGEVRSAELESFTLQEAVELARLLRSNYSCQSLSDDSSNAYYFQEMKRQAGF